MDARTDERIAYHYAIEKALAERLFNSAPSERKALYISAYDELFARVLDHPQWQRKFDAKASDFEVARQLRFLKRFLASTANFMEIGAGDCALARKVAGCVRNVIAVDVARSIIDGLNPKNLQAVITDGVDIPVASNTIDVAYSNQLMEHLHPDDARDQLANIFEALAPGGVYICVTPNRLSGPHDISRHFVDHAAGLHLKEYTISELSTLFVKTGFNRVRILISWQSFVMPYLLPALPFCLLERVLEALPPRVRRVISIPIGAAKLIGFKD